MSDSLYAQYVAEREGLSGIWKEFGFVTYRIRGSECFLSDIFVLKNLRKSGKCRELLSSLFQAAIENECSIVTANIFLADPNANNTIKAAIACGFSITSSANNVILISKDLRG